MKIKLIDAFQDHSTNIKKISSGHIGDRVAFRSFSITIMDRQSNKTNSTAVFVFAPSAGGSLPVSGTITLNHPANFFADSFVPDVWTNGSASIGCTLQTSTSIILTVQDGVVHASTDLTVTLKGLTMGSATSSVRDSMSVTTSHDANPVGVTTLASGPISDRIAFASFTVSLSDRVANKTGSSATLVFTPSAGGDISIGGTVTLFFPASFFLLESDPAASLSGGSTANVTSRTDSFIVLTVQSGMIAAQAAVTVTLTGLKMGDSTASIPSSVSVVSSSYANTENAMKLSSGHIGSRVTVTSLVIADADRVALKSGIAATLTFAPSAGGAIAAAGSLTLYYPSNFFDFRSVSELPTFSCSTSGVEGVVFTGQDWISVTTSGPGVIAANQPVVVTLIGLKMGPSVKRNATGFSMSTSQDQVMSLPFDSGYIGARVELLVFAIKFTDAVAGKLDSTATILFETSAGGAVAPGGQITVKYFAKGFFDTSHIPLFSCSVPLVTGSAVFDLSHAVFSSIVITTAGSGSIPGSSVITITLSGLAMGAVNDGGSVVLDTSADQDSLPIPSGPIRTRNYVRLL
jgi:hypothetical protein